MFTRDSAGWRRIWSAVELLAAVAVDDHQLTVEDVATLRELHLREVASQRLAPTRLQVDVVPVDVGEGTESVVLRLVGPVVPLRQLLAGEGELWLDRRLQRQGHRPILVPTPSSLADVANPPANCDLVVIGGGILGLAVARELLDRRPDASLCVLEREDRLAAHQTSHSSGVIHAGIYYEPGSLKARLCVEGARLLYAYCEERGIEARKDGKLIVATDQGELARLDELAAARRGQPGSRPAEGRAERDRRDRAARPRGRCAPFARDRAWSTSPGSRPPTRRTSRRREE